MQISGEIESKLFQNLKIVSGSTDGHWKKVEDKGTSYMVISLSEDGFIRGADNVEHNINYYEIDGKFIILDGIDYKSEFPDCKLIYMEV